MLDLRRINMRQVKEILRLKLELNLSHEKIARALNLSKGVVSKYVTLAHQAGVVWADIEGLNEWTIERRLLPVKAASSQYIHPDYEQVHQELKRKGMTLTLLWQEHVERHQGALTHQFSQFSVNYRHYVNSLKRSMRQVHKAGEKMFIDYAGPTLALQDHERAHIFASAMGASSYTFAYATPGERMQDWLLSIRKALEFYGGVPELIVPDKTRAL